MSKKEPSTSIGDLKQSLPSDFFDSDKKSKKAQEDELAKEMEQFEKEMAALEEESERHLNEEFEKLQEDKDIDELDQRIGQWKRVIELEKRAEALKNKTIDENPTKKFKGTVGDEEFGPTQTPNESENVDLDDIEDFEDKLFDWRCRSL